LRLFCSWLCLIYLLGAAATCSGTTSSNLVPLSKCTFLPLEVMIVAGLALDEGVIVYPCSGGLDGEAGDYLILAPPFVTSDDELEQMVRRTGRALRRLGDELARQL